MEHAAQLGISADYIEAIAVRLAVMDDDRLIEPKRELDLTDKQCLLLVLVLGVPIVVEPYLADGDAFGMPGKLSKLGKTLLTELVYILGVPADGGVDKVIFLRERYRIARAYKIAAGVDDEPDVFSRHGFKYFKAVGVERAAVVMRMGVKYHCNTSKHRALYHLLPRRRKR